MELIDEKYYKTYFGTKRPELSPEVPLLIKAANSLVTSLLGIDDVNPKVDLFTAKAARTKYFLNDPTGDNITQLIINDKEIASDNYKIYPGGILILKFTPTEGLMEVNYTSSGLNPIPEDLKACACMLVDYWAKQDYRESRSFGGETVTFNATSSGVPEHIKAIISAYRRV